MSSSSKPRTRIKPNIVGKARPAQKDVPAPPSCSLLDMPAAWLHRLLTSDSFGRDKKHRSLALLSLFRTCTFFRDGVAQHHQAALPLITVPLDDTRHERALRMLCAVARRSRNVWLQLKGPTFGETRRDEEATRGYDGYDDCPDEDEEEEEDVLPASWRQTEPHIAQLLVNAEVCLRGHGRSLACVKRVTLQSLELTALVPDWLKLFCPDIESLEMLNCDVSKHTSQPALPPSPPPSARPSSPQPEASAPDQPPLAAQLQLQHLRQLAFRVDGTFEFVVNPWGRCQMEQLAALPNLATLTVNSIDLLPGFDGLLSASVTRLVVYGTIQEDALPTSSLRDQLPGLREVEVRKVLGDALFEQLLALPHVEVIRAGDLQLRKQHTAPAGRRLRHLRVTRLHLDIAARLPLDSIVRCTVEGHVVPTADERAAEGVVKAVERGALGFDGRVAIDGQRGNALTACLRPLLSALPEAERRTVSILNLNDAAATTMERLAEQLPEGVQRLELCGGTFKPDAWPALLPSLPASVVAVCFDEAVRELGRTAKWPSEAAAVALCAAAVRPVTVWLSCLGSKGKQAVRSQLAQLSISCVTLL